MFAKYTPSFSIANDIFSIASLVDTILSSEPTFVDSIIAESVNYSLSENIALLDTPGYTKYDDESDSKLVISDRQKAYEQLKASDYLIWLVDIENGGLTEEAGRNHQWSYGWP